MYILPTTIKRPWRRCQRGSVALAALTALVVVFIIGVGLLTLGGNARLSGKRVMRLNAAQALATAGIEYGYWQRVYNSKPLPFTLTRALGAGKITITVTDNSANTYGTIQVVSTGTQNGDSVTLTRILLLQKTYFDYAMCSGSDLNIPQTVTTGSGGANGDVGANGNISLNKPGTVVNGDAASTGNISIKSITGTKLPNGAAITFPAIDISHYQSIAVQSYPGNQVFTGGFTFPVLPGGAYPVVIVNGNVTVNAGMVSGIGTVVVTGTITFTGNLSYMYSTDKIAVLCAGIVNAAPQGTPLSIAGFYYSHNSAGTASVVQPNSAPMTVTGGLAFDKFAVTGPLICNHDPTMNGTLGNKMHLPGY